MEIILITLLFILSILEIIWIVKETDKIWDVIRRLNDINKTSSEIDHTVKDRLDNISDILDLYKRLVDSLNDGQAQLNSRIQHLEMLNSNGGTLTDLKGNCPYTPNGLCGNPQHDCIDCPCHGSSGTWTTTVTDEDIVKAVSSASILDLVDDALSTTSQQLPPEAIHFTKED